MKQPDFILACNTRCADNIAHKHCLRSRSWRHLTDEWQVQGMAGKHVWVAACAARRGNCGRIMDTVKAARLTFEQVEA